ncbi:hypothetical protein NUW58_g2043 [Xylaria curta]|uniref:Uncharacterized protein n=1 Tax=Xylaria curta TaxID=42375 RepID=A0ACC1PKA6_9PEZI|nr:hypothetical protein NUW58_g2043 [Xylaria curta]
MPPCPNTEARDTLLARQILRFIDTNHPFTTLFSEGDRYLATHLGDKLHRADSLEPEYPLTWVESKKRFRSFIKRWKAIHVTYRLHHYYTEDGQNPADIPLPDSEPEPEPIAGSNIPQVTVNSPGSTQNTPHQPESLPPVRTQTEQLHPRLVVRRQQQPLIGPLQFEELSSKLRNFHVDRPSSSTQSSSTQSSAQPTPESVNDPAPPEEPEISPITNPSTGESPAAEPANLFNMAEALTAEAARRLLQEAMEQQEGQHARDMAALLAAQSRQNNQNMAQLFAAAQPVNQGVSSLRSSDVGYFDPGAKDPTSAGIIADGKITKYTDVFAFTDRLKHLAAQQSEAEVRKVWTQCLLGPALIWHSQVLSASDRELLETATIQAICNKLIERFKPSWSTAMGRLQTHQFTLENINKGHDILGFVQRVIRDAKGCDQSDTNQIKAAFEAFDGDIQSQLSVPTSDTTVDAFLTAIREREGVLKKMAKEKLTLPRAPQGNITPTPSFRPYRIPQNRADFPQYTQYPRGRGNYGRGFQQYPRPWTNQNQNQSQSPYQQQNNQQYPAQPYNDYQQRRWQGQNFPQWQQSYPQIPLRQGTTLVPPERRLPAPPPRGPAQWQQQQQQRPQKAYHGEELPTGTERPPDQWAEPHEQQDDAPSWNFGQEDFAGLETEIPQAEESQYQPSVEEVEDEYFATAFHGSAAATPKHECRDCRSKFPSKNKLHKHLEAQHGKARKIKAVTTKSPESGEAMHGMELSTMLNPEPTPTKLPNVVTSTAMPTGIGSGYSFRSYGYLKFYITPNPQDPDHQDDICGDTGCSKTLGDRTWIVQNFPQIPMRKRATPVTLRGIGSNFHTTDEYVILPMYFQGKDPQGKPATALFEREVAIVEDLRAHMLLGTDILQLEKFDILMSKKAAIINSCNVAIPMDTTPKGKPQRAPVRSAEPTIIKPHAYGSIPVHHAAEDYGEDLLFEPADHTKLSAFATLTTADMEEILVRNDTDSDIHIAQGHVVGHLMTVDPECTAYLVEGENATTAAEFAVKRPMPRSPKENPRASTIFTHDPAKTVKHHTGVNIYNDPEIIAAVSQLLDEFEIVFQDTGFADIPQDEWMKVVLKDDWQKEIPKHCRIYPLHQDSKQVVEDTLGKLRERAKIYRTLKQVPFSFPVFVIWRMVPQLTGPPKRKGRMVVDIRPGNKIYLPDAYPMRTQEEILDHVAGKQYQTVLDAIAFYYQWRVHPDSQWAFTITTHKGQFTFTCAVMGYKNSNAYVQRQMDYLLQDTAARSYCDDIVIASSTLEEHVRHLREVFTVFRDRNISIGPSKSYIAFPGTVVLGRIVDSFGMTTTAEKLEAIRRLKFPETLRDLEIFIGFTTWLRNSVPGYGIIVKPLQDRKTELLKRGRTGTGNNGQQLRGRNRKTWATSVAFAYPTKKERDAFTQIKESLLTNISLAFCSPVRQLFADFDASAEGIGIEVYHVKEEVIPKMMKDGVIVDYPPRHAVQTIAFLSRPLTNAERKYWPTEMELCGFVWLLKKTRQWLNTAKMTPIIFTDCKAILGLHQRNADIANSTASSNANRKIVHALEFISQFNIRILHKPGKKHIVPDALSRLPREGIPSDPDPEDPGGLDELPDDREEHWAMHWIYQQTESNERLPPMRLSSPDQQTFDINIPLGIPHKAQL